jgi:hypothetical protein
MPKAPVRLDASSAPTNHLRRALLSGQLQPIWRTTSGASLDRHKRTFTTQHKATPAETEETFEVRVAGLLKTLRADIVGDTDRGARIALVPRVEQQQNPCCGVEKLLAGQGAMTGNTASQPTFTTS